MVPARPRFPLPRDYFDQRPLSKEQQEHYKEIAQTQLEAAVKTENAFMHVQRRQVNSRRWRLVKKQEQLWIYRRRSGSLGPADAHALPHMLAVGHVDGSLEDILYGKYDKSYEELQASIAYNNASIRDSAVLHNIELATPKDPFRYLGLKWTLTQLPAAALVKPRDWCYLEALGIASDRDGERYGYAIAHSVGVPNCPPFDDRAAVRGRGSISIIFREVKPGRVEIFGYGLFDPSGDLIPHVSVTMTTEIFSTLGKAVQCAEAKKLTLLTLRNCNSRRGTKPPLQLTCYLCVKSTGLFASLKLCSICGATACAKCRVKRLIFTGDNHSSCEVVCCQTCILRAKSLEVRPAEESFAALFAEQHQQVVPKEAMWHGSRQWNSDLIDDDRQLFSHHDVLDDMAADDDDEGNSSSGKSEVDFEQIIEAMMTSRANGQESHNLSSSQLSQKTASSVSPLSRLYEEERVFPRTILASSQTRSNASTVASEQAALFNQMVALQNAARHVYAITQANQEMMKKL
ncbi:hypothetical protein FI667_g2860, partial [Globisporangium splendens]